MDIVLREDVFNLREYQKQAVDIFLDSGGHGVVCLPCGGGKTVVALATMAKLGRRALIPRGICTRGALPSRSRASDPCGPTRQMARSPCELEVVAAEPAVGVEDLARQVDARRKT